MTPMGDEPKMGLINETLDDIPTLEDLRLDGGFFAGLDRGEWLRNLEQHFRYGEPLILLCGDAGVGKSTLVTQLASRLDPAVFRVVTLDAANGGGVEQLWSAFNRVLTLPPGGEGWDELKRIARRLESEGQSLAVIIDHADKLKKDAVGLLKAMLDAELPETRFLLALDGSGQQAQWPLVAESLLPLGQVATLRPFSEDETRAYVEFRLKHANLGDVEFTERQQKTVYALSRGNAVAICTEMKRILASGKGGLPSLMAGPRSGGKAKGGAAKADKIKQDKKQPDAGSPKNAFKVPNAHTVALSVLAVALLGFYLVWEKPVPESAILTPMPNSQLPAPLLSESASGGLSLEDPAAPVVAAAPAEVAPGGLPSPVKAPFVAPAAGAGEVAGTALPASAAAPVVAGAAAVKTGESPAAAPAAAVSQAPAGFSPSALPLLGAASVADKPAGRALPSPVKSGKPALDPATAIALSRSGSGQGTDATPADAGVGQNGASSLAAVKPVTVSPASVASSKAVSSRTTAAKPVVASAAAKPASAEAAARASTATVAKKSPVATAKAATAAAKAATPTRAVAAEKSAYTLQIMGLRDVRSVQEVMRKHAGVAGLTYRTSTLNGQPWYVVTQGEYPDRPSAQAAIKRLPASLQAGKPFPKALADL